VKLNVADSLGRAGNCRCVTRFDELCEPVVASAKRYSFLDKVCELLLDAENIQEKKKKI
jgi:hypothetical protein